MCIGWWFGCAFTSIGSEDVLMKVDKFGLQNRQLTNDLLHAKRRIAFLESERERYKQAIVKFLLDNNGCDLNLEPLMNVLDN